MRLIGQEVDALAEHQLNEFAGERLLTGLALKCRSRPGAGIGVMSKRTLNVELTGPRRETAMSARSNTDQGVARAWTAAVGAPVEQRHVRRHFMLRGPS